MADRGRMGWIKTWQLPSKQSTTHRNKPIVIFILYKGSFQNKGSGSASEVPSFQLVQAPKMPRPSWLNRTGIGAWQPKYDKAYYTRFLCPNSMGLKQGFSRGFPGFAWDGGWRNP